MKIKTTMTMDYNEIMMIFEDHYEEEKSYAREYICEHTNEIGHYDITLTHLLMNAMDVKFYDFRFAFEKFVHEERKINNHNMENLVAFGLTLEYFGIENFEIQFSRS